LKIGCFVDTGTIQPPEKVAADNSLQGYFVDFSWSYCTQYDQLLA